MATLILSWLHSCLQSSILQELFIKFRDFVELLFLWRIAVFDLQTYSLFYIYLASPSPPSFHTSRAKRNNKERSLFYAIHLLLPLNSKHLAPKRNNKVIPENLQFTHSHSAHVYANIQIKNISMYMKMNVMEMLTSNIEGIWLCFK